LTRLLGSYSVGLEGPTVVLIGGMHGNEPAGTRAIPRVLRQLAEREAPLRGRVIGLAGNLGALAAGHRYLDRDLNRGWTHEGVAALLDPAAGPGAAEDREQRELLATLAPLLAEAREPLVFLDLHSTSGDSPPFTVMADVLRNRAVGLSFPLPVILGIEELLDGTLLGYFCDLGHVAVAVEGGQSQDPRTVANHEAAIWSTLIAAGSLPAGAVPNLEAHCHRLREAARGLPPIVEIRHRHLVRADDGFRMAPGWVSFMPVRRGQVVAEDRHGPVECPEAGLMLMPRYQAQGEDGYFVVRGVSPFWLRVSAVLRRARLDRLVPLLPGVRPHATLPDRYVVDPAVARWQVVNVFHLFGYRHVREAGDSLVFSRRRPGFRRLDRLPPELQRLADPGAEDHNSLLDPRTRS
jgi:succinylglutamate desuccinylase